MSRPVLFLMRVNPSAGSMNLLSANINYRLPTQHHIELNLYGNNLQDREYHFVEFSRGVVNTLPLASGLGIYGTVTFKF